MVKYCADCDFLDTKKEKKGKVSGSMFLCKKQTKAKKKDVYVNPRDNRCDNFEVTWKRNTFDRQRIYDKGKYWNDNDTPISTYLIILILLIVAGLILGVFN